MTNLYLTRSLIMLSRKYGFFPLDLRNPSLIILTQMVYVNIKRGVVPKTFLYLPLGEKYQPCPISSRYKPPLIKYNRLCLLLIFTQKPLKPSKTGKCLSSTHHHHWIKGEFFQYHKTSQTFFYYSSN